MSFYPEFCEDYKPKSYRDTDQHKAYEHFVGMGLEGAYKRENEIVIRANDGFHVVAPAHDAANHIEKLAGMDGFTLHVYGVSSNSEDFQNILNVAQEKKVNLKHTGI